MSAIAVPLHAAYKLVSQKQNCGFELCTTVSSGDILWGKLYRCLYLLGHLYGPTVPGLAPFWAALLTNMAFFEEKTVFTVSSVLFFGSPLVAVDTVQQLRRLEIRAYVPINS